MKMGAILLLSFALLRAAAGGSDDEITSKKTERDVNGGKTHVRLEEFYRGKKKILLIYRTTEAGFTKTTRIYDFGDIEITESDDRGDGTFETLVLFNTKTKELDAFSRKRDGSATPLDAKSLLAIKEEFAAIANFWDNFWDETLRKGASEEKFLESAKALKQKLSELEKEKAKDPK